MTGILQQIRPLACVVSTLALAFALRRCLWAGGNWPCLDPAIAEAAPKDLFAAAKDTLGLLFIALVLG